MAFISMVFAFLFIVAVILGGMFLVGLMLLIVGIVLKRSRNNAGKKSPVVCMVIGSVLLALPVAASLALCLLIVFSSAKAVLSTKHYESVPDRWRNEWVYDSQAEDDLIEALLTSADSGDVQAFCANFTPELQSREDFPEAVDAFFAVYPTGLSGCRFNDKNGGGSGSYNYGHNVKTYSTHFNATLDGQWYYVSISFCYSNTDRPDQVGVTNLKIMNLEAAAAFFDEYSGNSDYLSDVYLLCDIKSPDEVCARLIDGQPFLWTPTDTPKLTADGLRDLLKENRRLDAPALSEKLGEPNAFRKFYNSTGYDYYYELADRNGEACYVYFCTDALLGEIVSAYICTPYETDYDYALLDKDE